MANMISPRRHQYTFQATDEQTDRRMLPSCEGRALWRGLYSHWRRRIRRFLWKPTSTVCLCPLAVAAGKKFIFNKASIRPISTKRLLFFICIVYFSSSLWLRQWTHTRQPAFNSCWVIKKWHLTIIIPVLQKQKLLRGEHAKPLNGECMAL